MAVGMVEQSRWCLGARHALRCLAGGTLQFATRTFWYAPAPTRMLVLVSGYLPQAKKGQPLIVRPCKEYESNACGCLRLATVCIAYALLPCTVSCSVSDSCAWSCALAWYVWQRGERHCTPYVASKIMRRRPPSGRGCRLCASMSGRQDVLHRVLSVGLTARRKHVDSSDDDDAIDVASHRRLAPRH